MPKARKPATPAAAIAAHPDGSTLDRAADSHQSSHTPRKRARSLVDRCLICNWDGTEPEIWGAFSQQAWATPEHDLCTRPVCIVEYKARARAGTL